MEKIVKKVAFSLMGVLLVLLIAATILEKIAGTDVAVRYVYTAPWTIVLWILAVTAGMWYVVMSFRHGGMRLSVLGIHVSFAVILLGAMLTHCFGTEGAIALRIGESSREYVEHNGTKGTLPFTLILKDFQVAYYPGTATPEDYISQIAIRTDEGEQEVELSMNHIARYKGWRLYQSSYDADAGGCTLLLSHDPAGVGVTYTGYILLLISMLAYLFVPKRVRFCKKAVAGLMLLALPLGYAEAAPKTLQAPVAESFGNLYVEYNGRICPMSVLANDVCTKLYGRNYYQAEDGTYYSANQVLTGILFYYNDWQAVPLKHSRKAMQNREREMVLRMTAGGSLLKIWPGEQGWYDINSAGEADSLTHDEWNFRMYALQYVAYDLAQGQNIEANEILKKIRIYQQKCAPEGSLPTERHFRAEQLWAAFPYTKPLAILTMALGLVFFLVYCLTQGRGKRPAIGWRIAGTAVLGGIWVFLSVMLGWRWYVSRHIPLSNGHETMQTLAWLIMLIALGADIRTYTQKTDNEKVAGFSSFGLLLGGMPLMVSMMSASNPQITHLMPVLQSPLLSLHVSIIMVSYALLAFVMLNSIVALFSTPTEQENMMAFSKKLLHPAVCCLAIGIFLGAVWANVSWGRYWGWDPKEVWALITLLVYAAPLHGRSLAMFRNARAFHIYCLIAFASVLITYFGVNFLLGGMHAYA